MAYNPYRASYGLPPPTLPSPGKPVPQGIAPMAPVAPALFSIKLPKAQQAEEAKMAEKAELNASRSTIGSSNRTAVSILNEDFRPENLQPNAMTYGKEYHTEAMKAFDPDRIKAAKAAGGSSRAQQMVSSALAAAGGTSPSAPQSSPPARTVASNPGSKNGSTESLFGGLSPIEKMNNNKQRKRKSRKSRKSRKQSKTSRKVKKNYK